MTKDINFSKITKNWSSKPIKEKKDQTYLHKMAKETTESAANDQCLENPIHLFPGILPQFQNHKSLGSFKINFHVSET